MNHLKSPKQIGSTNLIESYGLPTKIPKIKKNEVIKILMGDKKVRDGKMRFILPRKLSLIHI